MPRKSTTRRAQGEGTIRQRKDGTWEARYTLGRDPGTGKQIRLRSAGYFCFQLLLFVLRIRQPLCVIVPLRIALLQLIAGLLKRALILTDRILLKLKGTL